jgi:Leucine Rich repeat
MGTMTMAVSPTPSPDARKAKASTFPINPLLRKHTSPPPVSDRQDRESFASFKEDRSAIAQSFIVSKISSYSRAFEEVIDDSASEENNFEPEGHHAHPFDSPMAVTNPYSMMNGFICPCEGFRGWKKITVGGKPASRSFSDLRIASKVFAWDLPGSKEKKGEKPRNAAGQSYLERLPMELLRTCWSVANAIDAITDYFTGSIIDQLATDIPPNGFQPRNIDLMSLLLTSRAMHVATLATLYGQVTIPHSKVFRKFLAHIAGHPALGAIVRRLDMSHFNPTGAGMTARERAETKNLTPQTLLQCLELLPNLREFLAQEHIDEELSADVIRKLFEMPRLQVLDFCACSSTPFRDAMMTVFRSTRSLDLPQVMPITRLSFHECTILPSAIFESLLPRLPYLTHLDVTHTRITDEALSLIPQSARLTHLNLSKCSSLSGEKVVEFLGTHPAVKDTLIYLNLLMDAKSHEMLDSNGISALLPKLPDTLRSLNLKGSKMSRNNLRLLQPLTKHLEELGIGRNLPFEDISSLLGPLPEDADDENEPWVPHTLRYLDISDFEASMLDFGLLFGSKTSILKSRTLPLEVIEVGTKAFDKLKEKEHVCKHFGWVVKEAGRRGWLVRDTTKVRSKAAGEPEAQPDDGQRAWKMGATSWGMRKIPVARAEVGGMYGLYMFKR